MNHTHIDLGFFTTGSNLGGSTTSTLCRSPQLLAEAAFPYQLFESGSLTLSSRWSPGLLNELSRFGDLGLSEVSRRKTGTAAPGEGGGQSSEQLTNELFLRAARDPRRPRSLSFGLRRRQFSSRCRLNSGCGWYESEAELVRFLGPVEWPTSQYVLISPFPCKKKEGYQHFIIR